MTACRVEIIFEFTAASIDAAEDRVGIITADLRHLLANVPEVTASLDVTYREQRGEFVNNMSL